MQAASRFGSRVGVAARLLSFIALVLVSSCVLQCAALPPGFSAKKLGSSVFNAIDLEFLPGGTMLVVQRHGVILYLVNGKEVVYLDISNNVDMAGEKGAGALLA
jgi:hypothetical protein